MLKYFKKRKGSGRRGIWADNPFQKTDAQLKENGSPEYESAYNEFGFKRNSLKSTSSFCDEILSQGEIDDDTIDGVSSVCGSLGGYSLVSDDEIFRYKSRLAMSLSTIVSDPNCLSYFVQYLDKRNALAPLKFYLDTENFKTAAIAHLEKRRTTEQSPLEYACELPPAVEIETSSESDLAYDNGRNVDATSRVPELKNYYDLSMRQPLTDDEKSQIYAETNKQIHKCNETARNINSNSTSVDSLDKKNTDLQINYDVDKSSLKEIATDEHKSVENVIGPASVKDAISIYQKYLIANASQFVSLPVAILSQISLLLCQRNENQSGVTTVKATDEEHVRTIPATCFDEAQRYVMEQLERMYLNDFLQSPFYSKYCIELVENGQPELSIYDILYSEATLFFFMEFLEQHGERECLDFWTSAINFRKSYEAATENAQISFDPMLGSDKCHNRISIQSDAQSDAMIIYEKFFSLQSEDRFWLSDRLRSRVEERICADGRIAYCFDLPLQLIAKYLECKYFQDFLKSQIFQNYLNELKLKLHETNEVEASKDFSKSTSALLTKNVFRKKSLHRKTLSDCDANKREVFKHNTLLAMDGNKLPHARIKRLQQTTVSDMHIDSRQLTNPNLLWRRSYSSDGGGLKFGHINELGRYERDFEAVDAAGSDLASGGKHHWSLHISGNKIKNAMRKLVNLPEDKVQEEIAWQVAEMIVKDVTNVTLKGDHINLTSNIDQINNKRADGVV